jgi:hypothetical protein
MVLNSFNLSGLILCGKQDSTIPTPTGRYSKTKNNHNDLSNYNDASLTLYYKFPSHRNCSIDTINLMENENIEVDDDLLLDVLSSSSDSIDDNTMVKAQNLELNEQVQEHIQQVVLENKMEVDNGNNVDEIIQNETDNEYDDESQQIYEMYQELEDDGGIIKILSYYSTSVDNDENAECFATFVDEFIEITDDFSLSIDTDDDDVMMIDKYHPLDEKQDDKDSVTESVLIQQQSVEMEYLDVDGLSNKNFIDEKDKQTKKNVSFGPVNVQEYAVTVGSIGVSNPEKVISCPLELSWEHSSEKSFHILEYEQQSKSKSRARKRIEGIKRPVPRYEPMVTEVLYEYISDDITTKRKLTDTDIHNVIKNKNIRKMLESYRNPCMRRHQRCVRLSEPERRQRISEVQGISIEHVKKIDREQRKNITLSNSGKSKQLPSSSSKVARVFKGLFPSKVVV